VRSPLRGISGADGCAADCVLSPGILLIVNSKGEVAPLGFGVGEGGVCVGCRVSKSNEVVGVGGSDESQSGEPASGAKLLCLANVGETGDKKSSSESRSPSSSCSRVGGGLNSAMNCCRVVADRKLRCV
jgi:hypothetical protein